MIKLKRGSTFQIVEVMLRDDATGQGKAGLIFSDITATYQRRGAAAPVGIATVAGVAGTHYPMYTGVGGGFVAVDAHGKYQFSIPNSALLAGVDLVTITLRGPGMIDKDISIQLTATDEGDPSSFGVTTAQVRTEADAALVAYAPATPAQVATQAANALNAYGPATNAQVALSIASALVSYGAATPAQVLTKAAEALATYDPATGAEVAALVPLINALQASLVGMDITVMSPILAGGIVEVVRYGDYMVADGRAIPVEVTGAPVMGIRDNITSVQFIIGDTDLISKSFAKTNSAGGIVVMVELTGEETAKLRIDRSPAFYLRAILNNGHEIPLVIGHIRVLDGGIVL